MLNLQGKIVGVSKYVPGCAIVKLNEAHEGRTHGAINHETQGRLGLITRLGGELLVGSSVTIRRATVGSEALLITEVE